MLVTPPSKADPGDFVHLLFVYSTRRVDLKVMVEHPDVRKSGYVRDEQKVFNV